ncbi:MAG: NIPSNAP family protein [Kiritimatiellae bacterium]|nr:NIPSNAP family protein [Kiritimatiellia bacterium]MDD5522050.1 NIPSNAP family protein [Kiritimatiellia bacterium]
MSTSIKRRDFLKSSIALAAVTGATSSIAAEAGQKKQEHYEVRVYRINNAEKQKVVSTYLEKALLPALNRMGIDRVGVFTVMDKPDDFSIYVLIPFPTMDTFANLSPKLLSDSEYQKASEEMLNQPKTDPAYTRIESRFYKAFTGMPVIEMPAQTAKKEPRMFEMRIYESHNEERAAMKRDMFNTGEIQLMRDIGMAPVYYGESLIGNDVPHLNYMLSASSIEEHKKHFDTFRVHPEWLKMKDLPKYKDTVSKITSIKLVPTAYSQI